MNIETIKISSILLSMHIYNFIIKNGYEFPSTLLCNLIEDGTYPLSIDKYNNTNDNMPISLMYDEPTKMYIVLDGRHRLVHSILDGRDYIKSNIYP